MPCVVMEDVNARVGSWQNSPILSAGHTHITSPFSIRHVTFLKHGLGMQSDIHAPPTSWYPGKHLVEKKNQR
jgi:hypothetical protein